MNLLFDIFQCIGVGAAIGIRPFFASLLVGGFAAAKLETHIDGTHFQFAHTSYAFLQGLPFLLVMFVLGVLTLVLGSSSVWGARLRSRPSVAVLSVLALVLAGLFGAGDMCREHHPVWIGIVAGVIVAAIGIAASLPFLERLRARLDSGAAAVGIPLVAEGSAIVIAAISLLLPPFGVVAALALLVLLVRGRGTSEQKYAGLRILR